MSMPISAVGGITLMASFPNELLRIYYTEFHYTKWLTAKYWSYILNNKFVYQTSRLNSSS